MSIFDTAALDLELYFERIAYSGTAAANLETLRELALRHPLAIPFENLNPFLGRPVALDVPSLQQKLLRDKRGGWCFEHNVLLGTVLQRIGYRVTGLAARVMWNAPPGVTPPRSHMVLYVDLDAGPFIVDAGFGGVTLTAPLRLEADIDQQTPHETFRLMQGGDEYVVQARLPNEWKPLYRFDLQRQVLADYEVSNWYLSTNPKSHFVTGIMAARVRADRRYALRNTDLSIHHLDGYTEKRVLLTGQEVRAALEQLFGLPVPGGADVDAAFERLVSPAAAPAAT